MAKQPISLGSTANDGTGDNLRTGGDKINDNFDELYTALGDGSTLAVEEIVQDIAGAMTTGNNETGINVSYNDTTGKLNFTVDAEWVQDQVGAMLTGNTETLITVTYNDASNVIDFVVQDDLSLYDASGFTLPASQVSVVDAGTWFTGTNAEAVLQELGAAVDGLDQTVSTISSTYLTAETAPVQYFNAGGSSSAARPEVGTNPDDIVIIWYNTGGVEPTNLGPNDIWQGIPGSKVIEVTAGRALAITDAGATIYMNSGSAIDLDVPLNATVAFVTGTIINMIAQGAGAMTVTAVSGVTINGTDSEVLTIDAGKGISLQKIGTNAWWAVGAFTV
jgi:hypothetical protein